MALSNSSKDNSEPFIIHNGAWVRRDSPLLGADNRGFRYGEGLFETILVKDGFIRLADYHFQRLFSSLPFLQFVPPIAFTRENLTAQIIALCKKNGHFPLARVRLVVFRGEDPAGPPDYIIQSEVLSPGFLEWNPQGLTLGLFPDGRKSCDALARLKSNNYLIYILAAGYAQKQGWDDCIVLNSRDRVADTSIANLFYVRSGIIYTPPLSEGGVKGVMRSWLLDTLPTAGYSIVEKETIPGDLENAAEIFLTNALRGVRWVRSFCGLSYSCEIAQSIYQLFP